MAWREVKGPAEAVRMVAVCLRLARGGGGGPTGAEGDFPWRHARRRWKTEAAIWGRGVASLCEASRGGEWDQERLGEAGWHSSWWHRAKPQQGTSGGGAAGIPVKLEVEDELEDLFVKWKKIQGAVCKLKFSVDLGLR